MNSMLKGLGSYEFGEDYSFEDIFPNASPFAGVKALFFPMAYRYLCFANGNASGAAAKAGETPWVICIGAMNAEASKDQQRVLNLVRLTTSQQKTSHLISTAEEKDRYKPWSEAVAVTDVFQFINPPHVIRDLGLQTHPLKNAQTQVCPLNAERLPIIAALRGYRISLADLPPLPPNITLGKLVSTDVSVEEGRAIAREATQYERDPKLARLVKTINCNKNGGVCLCEGCGFQDRDFSLFDAHHKIPLHVRVQTTTPKLMAVLCPTCHRVVHRLAEKSHLPMPIMKLRDWHAARSASLTVA